MRDLSTFCRAGSPRSLRAAAALLLSAAFAPLPALAGPLDAVLGEAAQPAESQVLDDKALSEIRGRGMEGLDPTATSPGDLAVILWDEQKGDAHRNQRGLEFSHNVGNGNAQATTLVMQRY